MSAFTLALLLAVALWPLGFFRDRIPDGVAAVTLFACAVFFVVYASVGAASPQHFYASLFFALLALVMSWKRARKTAWHKKTGGADGGSSKEIPRAS